MPTPMRAYRDRGAIIAPCIPLQFGNRKDYAQASNAVRHQRVAMLGVQARRVANERIGQRHAGEFATRLDLNSRHLPYCCRKISRPFRAADLF